MNNLSPLLERNATQGIATQRSATQRNAVQRNVTHLETRKQKNPKKRLARVFDFLGRLFHALRKIVFCFVVTSSFPRPIWVRDGCQLEPRTGDNFRMWNLFTMRNIQANFTPKVCFLCSKCKVHCKSFQFREDKSMLDPAFNGSQSVRLRRERPCRRHLPL